MAQATEQVGAVSGERSPGPQGRPHRRPCPSACVWDPRSPLPLKEALLSAAPLALPCGRPPEAACEAYRRVAWPSGLSPLAYLPALCAVELEARRGSVPRAASVGKAACLI